MKQFVITDINGNVHMVNGDDWKCTDGWLIIMYNNGTSKARYRLDAIIGFEIRR